MKQQHAYILMAIAFIVVVVFVLLFVGGVNRSSSKTFVVGTDVFFQSASNNNNYLGITGISTCGGSTVGITNRSSVWRVSNANKNAGDELNYGDNVYLSDSSGWWTRCNQDSTIYIDTSNNSTTFTLLNPNNLSDRSAIKTGDQVMFQGLFLSDGTTGTQIPSGTGVTTIPTTNGTSGTSGSTNPGNIRQSTFLMFES